MQLLAKRLCPRSEFHRTGINGYRFSFLPASHTYCGNSDLMFSIVNCVTRRIFLSPRQWHQETLQQNTKTWIGKANRPQNLRDHALRLVQTNWTKHFWGDNSMSSRFYYVWPTLLPARWTTKILSVLPKQINLPRLPNPNFVEFIISTPKSLFLSTYQSL